MAKRWTEDEIALFWEMKEGGATLREIAEALGRPYTAVATKASELAKPGREDMSAEDCRKEALNEQKQMLGGADPEEAVMRADAIMPRILAAAALENAGLGGVMPEAQASKAREQMMDTAMACARRCGFELSGMKIEYSDCGLDIRLSFAPPGAMEPRK